MTTTISVSHCTLCAALYTRGFRGRRTQAGWHLVWTMPSGAKEILASDSEAAGLPTESSALIGVRNLDPEDRRSEWTTSPLFLFRDSERALAFVDLLIAGLLPDAALMQEGRTCEAVKRGCAVPSRGRTRTPHGGVPGSSLRRRGGSLRGFSPSMRWLRARRRRPSPRPRGPGGSPLGSHLSPRRRSGSSTGRTGGQPGNPGAPRTGEPVCHTGGPGPPVAGGVVQGRGPGELAVFAICDGAMGRIGTRTPCSASSMSSPPVRQSSRGRCGPSWTQWTPRETRPWRERHEGRLADGVDWLHPALSADCVRAGCRSPGLDVRPPAGEEGAASAVRCSGRAGGVRWNAGSSGSSRVVGDELAPSMATSVVRLPRALREPFEVGDLPLTSSVPRAAADAELEARSHGRLARDWLVDPGHARPDDGHEGGALARGLHPIRQGFSRRPLQSFEGATGHIRASSMRKG